MPIASSSSAPARSSPTAPPPRSRRSVPDARCAPRGWRERGRGPRHTSIDGVDVIGDTVTIHAADSDAVARHLLTATPARDPDHRPRPRDAFVALTTERTQEN